MTEIEMKITALKKRLGGVSYSSYEDRNEKLLKELIDSKSVPENGTRNIIDTNIVIEYEGHEKNVNIRPALADAVTTYDIFRFTIEIGEGVSVGILSGWLYDILKDQKSVSLVIGSEGVDIGENEIQKRLEDFEYSDSEDKS